LLPYFRVLRVPGARRLFLVGALGTLPISMVTPGLLLLVAAATGSLARAGAVSGALAVGNAVGLVVQGRLIDARGRVQLPLGWVEEDRTQPVAAHPQRRVEGPGHRVRGEYVEVAALDERARTHQRRSGPAGTERWTGSGSSAEQGTARSTYRRAVPCRCVFALLAAQRRRPPG